MRKSDHTVNRPWQQTSFAFAPVPMELLVQDVYASSRPEVQKHMLAQLVGKVYEAAPTPLRTRWLELGPADEQTARPDDAVALVEHVLQVSGEALHRLTQLLINAPALAGSEAAAVLIAILLQRGQFRRVSDRLALFPPGMRTA